MSVKKTLSCLTTFFFIITNKQYQCQDGLQINKDINQEQNTYNEIQMMKLLAGQKLGCFIISVYSSSANAGGLLYIVSRHKKDIRLVFYPLI
jgi:hypothetical protein